MSPAYWSLLILLGAAFGASFGINEILLQSYGPLTVSAIRVGLGALGCWVWVVATRRQVRLVDISILGVCTFGIFQYAAPFALLPLAQGHISSSAAGIANAMTPVAVVVMSHLWPGGERATAPKVAGVVIGVLGMTVLVSQGSETGVSDRKYLLVAVLAPLCYGIALNLVRRFRGLDPVVMTAVAMTGGALAILPVALAMEGIPALPAPTSMLAFAVLGFGLTSAAFLTMYSILPKVGAVNLSLVTLVAPISATLIGVGVLGETIGGGHLLGMALILAGLVTIDGRLWLLLRPARASLS